MAKSASKVHKLSASKKYLYYYCGELLDKQVIKKHKKEIHRTSRRVAKQKLEEDTYG